MLQADQFRSRESWLACAPGLHIGEGDIFQKARAFRAGNEQAADLDARLKDEGYFRLRHDFGIDFDLMAATVRRFSAENISPVFCFLFDEFWAPFHAMDGLYGQLLGDYAMLPDFWVWNVDPAKGDEGWKPHRDRGHIALRPDGSPISLTTWIPLSSATPLNSCMYLVPANMDPTYGTAHEGEWRFELPAVRALPAEPGDLLVWNQAVLHWGSRTAWRERESRVSMAFEFQRTDAPAFHSPLIRPSANLPFEARLQLVARQVLQYRHMYRVDPMVERMALDLIGG